MNAWRCAWGHTGIASTPAQAERALTAHYDGPCNRGDDRQPLGQPLEPHMPPPRPIDPAAWYDDDRND